MQDVKAAFWFLILYRDHKDAREEFISSYRFPGPSTEVSKLFVANWKGFFTPTCAIKLLSLLRQCMVQEELPFFGLTLHRFDDDPTRPLSKHQSLLLNRASELIIVCSPNGRYCLFQPLKWPFKKKEKEWVLCHVSKVAECFLSFLPCALRPSQCLLEKTMPGTLVSKVLPYPFHLPPFYLEQFLEPLAVTPCNLQRRHW